MSAKRFLSLCSIIGALGLCSCNPAIPSSSTPEASISSSSVEAGLPDVVLVDKGSTSEQLDKDGNLPFALEEFPETLFRVVFPNGYQRSLYIDETLICDDLFGVPVIIASDVNKDGYRELVFDRNGVGNDPGNRFVVYDVKNGRTLMDEETDAAVGNYSFYRFNYSLINGKLTFYPYQGNYSENSIVDYATLGYSKEKGVYFQWQNIFTIQSIALTKISLNEGDHALVEPSKENGKDVYQFEVGPVYLMEYKVTRENYERNLGQGFLSLYWNNEMPSHFNRYEPSSKLSDPEKGIYVDAFSLRDECASSAWNFFFGEFGFSVNYRIVA